MEEKEKENPPTDEIPKEVKNVKTVVINENIARRVHNLVAEFQERAERVKERLNQPPTPSPTPPLEQSPTRSPRPVSRPRLESLIQQEDVNAILHRQEGYTNLCGLQIKNAYIPSIPPVLDPQSKIYITWLCFVTLSYVYNAWVIVLRAVFPYQTPETLPMFLVFDYIADIIYVIDIAFFKVRLQYLHDGFWVTDPEKTRKHYSQKILFKMDVLSLLPLDLLYFVYGVNPLFRLPRMLKTQTFWEFFHRVDAVAKTPYVIRIIRTLIYMMYLIHLNACAYYAMSIWEGIASNNWVFQGEGNAYIRCFYFATKTATSIGKNPKPENEYEYIFMTISWLMGVFIFAFLIGQIRDIVATATQNKTHYRQLMDHTVMYMRNLSLPDDLQRRVRLWLNHTWEQQKTLNESGILDSLPRKMKTDVAINVHYNTLVKVQLFKDCDKALLRDLVLSLKPVLFLPGDYICRKGEVGKEMYIVNKGLVQVIDNDNVNTVLATLSEGSVFGEISLLGIPGCNRRTADVRSQGFSNLFVLSKDDLWEALKNYPEAQNVLRKKAKMLIKENEKRDRASKSGGSHDPPTTVIVHHDFKKPATPKLLRTVMELVPRDSKCTQMLMGRKLLEMPPVEDVSSEKGEITLQRGVTVVSVQLHHPPPIHRPVTRTATPRDVPLSAKSELRMSHLTTTEASIEIVPSDEFREEDDIVTSLAMRFENTKDVTACSNPITTRSEDSGIGSNPKSSSFLPSWLGDTSELTSFDSDDDSIHSTIGEGLPVNIEDDYDFSRASSVVSLNALFKTESQTSVDRVETTESLELIASREIIERPSSRCSSSSSTSAGYDNLSYVPAGLFSSRKSSIFSDTLC